MATYFLDTSVIIDALNNKRGRRDLLLDLLRQGHLLACCAINVAEVFAGLRPKEEKTTEEFLRSLEYYHITWPVARLAGLLKRDRGKKGIMVSIADAASPQSRFKCALLAPVPVALAASSMLRWVKTARRSLLGTFYDEEVHRYVDVEHERGEVLYHFAIGHPVAGPRFKR